MYFRDDIPWERFVDRVFLMSESTGSKSFCKTCYMWVSNHPANLAKHQSSDIHKNNVRAKIRQADESKKRELAASRGVKPEIEKISKAAEDAMLGRPALSGTKSHPLTQGYDIVYNKPQPQNVWQTCRSKEGKFYYLNRVTGQTQLTKPPELEGIGPAAPPLEATPSEPKNLSSVPPPRPKTGAAPPPRPKTSAPKPRPEAKPVEGDSRVISASIAQPEPDSALRVDPTTGFGEWEDVDESSQAPVEEKSQGDQSVPTKEDLVLEMKEAARFGGRMNSADLQVAERRLKTFFSGDAEEEPPHFKRVITKKPRRVVDNDD